MHGFQLCTVYSLEVEQTGQGCFKASVSSFFFFFASAESPQAGGQLFTRRESLTHIHRLLTHLAHLYAREKAKTKKVHRWYLELIQLGLTGHAHRHGLPHVPNGIVPFEKHPRMFISHHAQRLSSIVGIMVREGENKEYDGDGWQPFKGDILTFLWIFLKID